MVSDSRTTASSRNSRRSGSRNTGDEASSQQRVGEGLQLFSWQEEDEASLHRDAEPQQDQASSSKATVIASKQSKQQPSGKQQRPRSAPQSAARSRATNQQQRPKTPAGPALGDLLVVGTAVSLKQKAGRKSPGPDAAVAVGGGAHGGFGFGFGGAAAAGHYHHSAEPDTPAWGGRRHAQQQTPSAAGAALQQQHQVDWDNFFRSPIGALNTPAGAAAVLDDLWAHLDRISPKFSVQKPDGYVPLTPASLVGTPYFSPAPSFGHIIAVPPSAQQQQHGSQAFLSLPGGGFGGFGDATLAQPQQSGQQDDASPSSSDGGASSYQTGASQSSWAQWIAEQIAQAETPAATEGGGSATADTPYTGGSDYHSAASGGGGGSSDGYHSAVEGSSLLTEASLLRLGADFEDGQQRQQHLLTAADADAGSATLATLAGSAHGEWDPDVGAAAKASGRRQHGQAPDFGLATLSLRPPGGGAAAAAAAETSADAAAAASPGVMMATIRSQTFGFSARSDVAVTPGFKAAAAAAPRVAAQSQRSAASALAAAAASSSKPTAAPKAEVRPAAAAPPPLSANAAAASSLMAAAMPPFTVQKAQHVTPSRQLAGSRHVQGSPEATDATTRRLFGSPGPESSSEHQQQPTPVLRGATAMPHRQPYAAPDTTYPQPQALHNQRQKTCADAAVQTDLLGVQLAQLLAAAAAHAPPPSSAVHATGAASESPVALALRFSGDATAANSPLAAAAAAAAVSAAASTGGAPAASSSVSDSAQDLYATVFSSLAAAASKVGGSPGGFNFGVSPSSHYPQPATPASFFHAAVPPSQQQLPHLTQQPRLLVDSGDASAAASSPVSQLLTRNELPPTPSLIAGNNATLAKRLRVLQMVFEAARAQAANGAPALLG